MKAQPRFGSHAVARNSGFYFLSLALPAVAALFLVPVTVRSLGPVRFGLLALAWAIAESSGIFDLGLARTTVRYVANSFAAAGGRLVEIVVTSFLAHVALGIIAGAALFAVAPVLVERAFDVPAALEAEATAMFRVLAFHVPILLTAAALRATLEGAQRFDVSSAVRITGSLSSIVIAAAGASAGLSLPSILWLLLGARLALALASAVAVRILIVPGRLHWPSNLSTVRELLTHSGWVAISAALQTALGNLERFMTGAIVGVAGLGYYAGAAEGATRFLLIPATAFAALLPALSHTDAVAGRDRALAATGSARRQLAALLLPLCLCLFTFAPDILGLWLGEAYELAAGRALRIMALGVFLGGLAHLPMVLLYGLNRPDLPAKINFGELIFFVPLTYFMVTRWGITGAAMAWTTRSAVDLASYEWAAYRALGFGPVNAEERRHFRRLAVLAAYLLMMFAGAAWIARFAPAGAAAAVVAGVAAYAAFAWLGVLTERERHAWLGVVPSMRRPSDR